MKKLNSRSQEFLYHFSIHISHVDFFNSHMHLFRRLSNELFTKHFANGKVMPFEIQNKTKLCWHDNRFAQHLQCHRKQRKSCSVDKVALVVVLEFCHRFLDCKFFCNNPKMMTRHSKCMRFERKKHLDLEIHNTIDSVPLLKSFQFTLSRQSYTFYSTLFEFDDVR